MNKCYLYTAEGIKEGTYKFEENVYKILFNELTKSKNVSIKRFEGEYGLTPDEATIKHYKRIEAKTLKRIEELKKDLKFNIDELEVVKVKIQYNKLLEDYPEEFI